MSKPKPFPWYKEKYGRSKYLSIGPPHEINDEVIQSLPEWIPIAESDISIWEDLANVLFEKNKKREFMITPSKREDMRIKIIQDGDRDVYSMSIEVLHVDHRGFVYTSTNSNEEELKRRFYPTVIKLIAYYISPRMLRRPGRMH